MVHLNIFTFQLTVAAFTQTTDIPTASCVHRQVVRWNLIWGSIFQNWCLADYRLPEKRLAALSCYAYPAWAPFVNGGHVWQRLSVLSFYLSVVVTLFSLAAWPSLRWMFFGPTRVCVCPLFLWVYYNSHDSVVILLANTVVVRLFRMRVVGQLFGSIASLLIFGCCSPCIRCVIVDGRYIIIWSVHSECCAVLSRSCIMCGGGTYSVRYTRSLKRLPRLCELAVAF